MKSKLFIVLLALACVAPLFAEGQEKVSSKVKIGADASAAAGPVGRNATARTEVVLKAEILSYSRAKGLFASISLADSTLRSDDGGNKTIYRRDNSAKEIVREGRVPAPAAAQRMLAILQKNSPRHMEVKSKS